MPKVLLVDDNEEMLDTLEQIFMFYQFEVTKSSDGLKAIEVAESTQPDLILLDAMMPVMDGFEACKILKRKTKTKDIPVVFLTAKYTHAKDRVTGLKLGADDYLLKPFNSKELVARCKGILKRNEVMRHLKNENERLAQKNENIAEELKGLLERSKKLDKDSFIDQLTGLYNLLFFKRRLKEEYLRALRYKTALSLVIIRINDMNKINEGLGYQLGNYILIKMANYLLSKTRVSDILARAEDDKFFVILTHTDEQGASLEAERIRVVLSSVDYMDDEMIETVNIPRRKISEYNNITVNLGVATFNADNDKIENEEELLKNAQEALRVSKSSGINKTIAYGKMN